MIDDGEYFESAAQGFRPFSDFEWFAIDSNGHIAYLTSAGFGAIPLVVFRSKPEYFNCANYFEVSPEQSDYTLHQDVPYKVTSWINAAKRGLYGYDWDCGLGWYEVGKPYRLFASPNQPLTFSELPLEIQEYLSAIRFKSVNFIEAAELFPETDFPENNWSIFK